MPNRQATRREAELHAALEQALRDFRTLRETVRLRHAEVADEQCADAIRRVRVALGETP